MMSRRRVEVDGRNPGNGRRVDTDRVPSNWKHSRRQVSSPHRSRYLLAVRAQLSGLRTEQLRQGDQGQTETA